MRYARHTLLFAALLVAPQVLTAADSKEAKKEGEPPLLTLAQLEMRHVSSVTYYYCPLGTECALRCGAGADQVSISYDNVRRAEVGDAENERLVGVDYADALGKSHIATSFFPKPSSCALEDLVLEGVSSVEEGSVVPPTPDKDVVFEVERQQ